MSSGSVLLAALLLIAPLFTVFVVLKVLADLSSHIPQWRPKEAPAWMTRHLNPARGKGKPGSEDFASYWKRTEAKERTSEANDEIVEKT